MPVIKLQHVSSASSEDPNHPADNLLHLETYRKWQCSSSGEKQAVVVLQFEKSSQIHSVDIGNNGSAFVEVLVGRSTNSSTSSNPSSGEYQVLLVASSFMSPVEGKAWTNTTRVRMFGRDKLSKSVAEQKWDKVKIVCTQPYNKSEQYGLSFIKFHSPPETGTDSTAEQDSGSSVTRLGAFALKEERKTLPSGSLFFRKDSKEKSEGEGGGGGRVSLAAQARQVSTAMLSSGDGAAKPVNTSDNTRGRVGGASISAPPTKRPKVAAFEEKKRKELAKEEEEDESVPFGKLMDGVVFALSGFKNPYRGELREKAMELGAKYEPDWCPSCTHLVCAFPNTPKFNQVKAVKGVVVKREWVLDSHKKKRRLPAKRYRFHSGDASDSEEEEDLYDKKEAAIFKKKKRDVATLASPFQTQTQPEHGTQSVSVSGSSHMQTAMLDTLKEEEQKLQSRETERGEIEADGKRDQCDKVKEKEEEDLYGGSTDEGSDMDEDQAPSMSDCHGNSDDYDTDEEIRRLKEKQDNEDGRQEVTAGPCSHQLTTNEETETGAGNLMDLPNLFAGSHFFLYGDELTSQDRQMLTRYILAYAGVIEEYMSENVTHVISSNNWDDNFDQALADNGNLLFVKPQWIFMCHSSRTLLPHTPYQIAQ